jgi:type II secretory ATPase GspE/PulE/Tfp pilus assembly ATPase PilB-like protein
MSPKNRPPDAPASAALRPPMRSAPPAGNIAPPSPPPPAGTVPRAVTVPLGQVEGGQREHDAAGIPGPSVGEGTPLDHIPLFAPLGAQVRIDLAARMKKKVVNAGDIIFSEGEPGDAMYVVEDGYVSIFVTDPAMGLTIDVASLGRGEAFGEMALVTGEGRTASVKALERTSLWVLRRDVFFRLVQAVPQMGLTIAATLAHRLDEMNRTQRVAFGTLRGASLPPDLREAVPTPVILRHKMVPVSTAAGLVTLACVDPQNRVGIDEMKRLLRGIDIKLMVVTEDDFNRFMAAQMTQNLAARVAQQAQVRNYGVLAKGAVSFLGAIGDVDVAHAKAAANNADVVELLNQILFEAIDRGASDIHIEPERASIVVRYRIDGRLVLRSGEIPVAVHHPLVSRLKVLAAIDIAEKRMPQDGRISLKVNAKTFDLRIATVNTKHGEKVVMRVLDPSSLQADLGSLILADKVCTAARNLFYRPNGLVLVTGPTGSGKSTTLYAAIAERRSPELSIATIEDPIEYTMDGITQVQVNEAIRLGFPDVMRTFLRQDPNVILVGETRDAETAKLACSAALTGHLVISSFHTNDAIAAVQRLRAMEVENYLIADALLGVINQRLVRRLCPACRVETNYGELVVQNLQRAGVVLDPRARFFKGQGCAQCRGEGFKGRAGVYELLLVNPVVREAIARGAPAHEIRLLAAEGSYVNLARYATFLLAEGLTVPSEILRILPKAEGPLSP